MSPLTLHNPFSGKPALWATCNTARPSNIEVNLGGRETPPPPAPTISIMMGKHDRMEGKQRSNEEVAVSYLGVVYCLVVKSWFILICIKYTLLFTRSIYDGKNNVPYNRAALCGTHFDSKVAWSQLWRRTERRTDTRFWIMKSYFWLTEIEYLFV